MSPTAWDDVRMSLGFPSQTAFFRRTLEALPSGTTSVKFVRYTMISTQVEDFVPPGTCNPPNGNFSGCAFIDSVELGVYGAPA